MIFPTSLAFVLTALSPAAWNSRNRRRISLWSALSTTIASDDTFSPGNWVASGNRSARTTLRPAAKRSGGRWCACRGELRVAAAPSGQAGLLELSQLQNDEGSCRECFRTGRPVTAAGLADAPQRWPRLAAAAVRSGFHSVEALPTRLRSQGIGVLNSWVVIE